MDKGTFSNVLSGLVFAIGLLLPAGGTRDFTLTIGMFAFSGGITNALAVKMLFDRIPGLIGSGVIPARFREIRSKIKTLILEHFFSESYLRDFLARETGRFEWRSILKTGPSGRGPIAGIVERQWDRFTAPERIEPIIDEQLEKLMDTKIGGLLLMAGMQSVRPAVREFVNSFISSLKGKVLDMASRAGPGDEIDVEIDEEKVLHLVREKVEQLLERKLEELDSATVKRMMEDVIRHHLGWLVVWGNVFGAALGVLNAFLHSHFS